MFPERGADVAAVPVDVAGELPVQLHRRHAHQEEHTQRHQRQETG